MKTKKIYSKQTLKDWLHWYIDTEHEHITMRLAWKPSLLLEKFRDKYDKEWDKKYIELLVMLEEIGKSWLSPFVFYISELKKGIKKKED